MKFKIVFICKRYNDHPYMFSTFVFRIVGVIHNAFTATGTEIQTNATIVPVKCAKKLHIRTSNLSG